MALATAPVEVPAGSGPWQLARAELRRRTSVKISLVIVVLFVLMAVAAPLLSALSGWAPDEFDKSAIDPDLGGLPLGPLGGISRRALARRRTRHGRDMFARIVYGARVSLLIALHRHRASSWSRARRPGSRPATSAAAPTRCSAGSWTSDVLPRPHLHDRDAVGGRRQPDRAADRGDRRVRLALPGPRGARPDAARSSTASSSRPPGSADRGPGGSSPARSCRASPGPSS